MKRTLISMLLGCLLLTAVQAGAQAKGKISDGVVKIGVITDLSGLYSDLSGQGSIIAAQMAVADFGGKVLGRLSRSSLLITRTSLMWRRARRAIGSTRRAWT